MKRQIIKIDEEKCNGCGLCVPNCPEGALQIIDGKARLVGELLCDGLGACIGNCPEGAITIEEREAEEYQELKVMENVVKAGKNVLTAHLKHLKDHGQQDYLKQAMDYLKAHNISIPEEDKQMEPLPCGCPGTMMKDFRDGHPEEIQSKSVGFLKSELRQWPIQLQLLNPQAPYFKDADLLIAADCVPFAYANFHNDLLKGKILLVGCPKLDDIKLYEKKITQILKNNDIKSITCVHMEVPCCFGLISIIKSAISASDKEIPFHEVNIGIKGEKLK